MTEFLNAKDLQSKLKISESTLYRLRRKGLPVVRIGKATRYDEKEVMQWLLEQNKK